MLAARLAIVFSLEHVAAMLYLVLGRLAAVDALDRTVCWKRHPVLHDIDNATT